MARSSLYDMCVGKRASKGNKDLVWRGDSQCAKLFQRYLSFDIASAKRNIYKSRSTTGEQYTRSCAQFTNPHRAHGNVRVLCRDEIDQSRQLRRSVGACRQLENIRAIRLRRARFVLATVWESECFSGNELK